MINCNVIAHRGANLVAPQNTLEAFRKSIEIGCDGFETDTALDEIKKLDKKVENPPIFLLRVGKVYPNQILG